MEVRATPPLAKAQSARHRCLQPFETQSEPQPAPPVPEDEPASGTDEKHSARTLVTGILHASSADSSTVIIDMQGEVQYEAHRLGSPERIYFDLHDTSLAPGMFGKTIEIGDARLARVRIAQPSKRHKPGRARNHGSFRFLGQPAVESLPAGGGNPEKQAILDRGASPSLPKSTDDQAANRAPAGGPRAGAEQARGTIAGTGPEVPPGARCRTRRLGPGNGRTQGLDGKRSGPGYRAPPGQSWSRAVWARKSFTPARMTLIFPWKSGPRSPTWPRLICSSPCTRTTATIPRLAVRRLITPTPIHR